MNTQVIKREGTHTIKSLRPGFPNLEIIGGIQFVSIVQNTFDRLAIPREDISNLIKALQPFANEVNEEKSV